MLWSKSSSSISFEKIDVRINLISYWIEFCRLDKDFCPLIFCYWSFLRIIFGVWKCNDWFNGGHLEDFQGQLNLSIIQHRSQRLGFLCNGKNLDHFCCGPNSSIGNCLSLFGRFSLTLVYIVFLFLENSKIILSDWNRWDSKTKFQSQQNKSN